jgi:hypothetical protein
MATRPAALRRARAGEAPTGNSVTFRYEAPDDIASPANPGWSVGNARDRFFNPSTSRPLDM